MELELTDVFRALCRSLAVHIGEALKVLVNQNKLSLCQLSAIGFEQNIRRKNSLSRESKWRCSKSHSTRAPSQVRREVAASPCPSSTRRALSCASASL